MHSFMFEIFISTSKFSEKEKIALQVSWSETV